MRLEDREFALRLTNRDYHKPMVERFGERYLRYRKDWDRSGMGELLPSFPLHIDFEIIDACNLKCKMCPRSIEQGSGLKLPLQDFQRVIDEGAKMGLKAIELGGGEEPLLRKELPDMISYAASKGIMDIRLGTNGTLLNPQLSQRLLRSGLTFFSVSVDAATATTYRKIRGWDLSKLENNITTFLNILAKTGQALPVTRVSFVAMPENIEEIDDFITKWSSIVDIIDIQDYIEMADPSIVNVKGVLEGFSCYQPWQRLTITAQGDVAPCCTFHGRKLLIGNVHERTIAELWNSEEMKKLRAQLLTKNPPLECKYCYASTKRLYKLPNYDNNRVRE